MLHTNAYRKSKFSNKYFSIHITVSDEVLDVLQSFVEQQAQLKGIPLLPKLTSVQSSPSQSLASGHSSSPLSVAGGLSSPALSVASGRSSPALSLACRHCSPPLSPTHSQYSDTLRDFRSDQQWIVSFY